MEKYIKSRALAEGAGSNANVSLDAAGRELGRYGHSTLAGVSEGEGAGASRSDGGRNVHLPRQVGAVQVDPVKPKLTA
jgi:hypothetical protein